MKKLRVETHRRATLILAAGLALVAVGCHDGPAAADRAARADDARQRPPVDPETLRQARELYDTRCSPCHGATGAGDGPQGQPLNPRPRNYTDPGWQRSISDAKIASTIIKGGAEVSLSPTMPANPDLKRKPDLVNGLVEIIRGFRR